MCVPNYKLIVTISNLKFLVENSLPMNSSSFNDSLTRTED